MSPPRSKEPLVPVNGARLRLARERAGLSLSALARAAKVSDPLLGRVERNDELQFAAYRSMTPDRLKRIAKAVLLDSEEGLRWLGDRQVHVRIPKPGTRTVEEDTDAQRADMAVSRLCWRVGTAFRRDRADGYFPFPTGPGLSRLKEVWKDDKKSTDILLAMLSARVDGSSWRSRLVEGGDADHGTRLAATVHLCSALEAVLEPWLQGRTELKYKAFYEFISGGR